MFVKRITALFLLSGGTILDEKYRKFELPLFLYLVLSGLVLIIQCILSAFYATTLSRKTLLFGYLIGLSFAVVLQYWIKIKTDLLLNLFNRLNNEKVPNFVRCEINTESAIETERKEYFWVLLVIITSFWNSTACPIIYFFIKDEIRFEDEDLHFLPFNYPQFWKTNTLMEYLMMQCLEIFFTVPAAMAFIGLTISTIYIVNNMKKHAKEIGVLFSDALYRNLDKYSIYCEHHTNEYQYGCNVKSLDDKQKRKFNETMRGEIIKLVQYHQFIDEYVKDFQNFMKFPNTAKLILFVCANILVSYPCLQAQNDPVFLTKSVSLMVQTMVDFCLFCHTNHMTNEMNENIMKSFQFSQWYYLAPDLRKYWLTIMLKCQNPYRSKSFGMFVVNLNFFLRCVRTVYSVLNILLVMQTK